MSIAKKAHGLVPDLRRGAWIQPLFFGAIGVLNTATDFFVFLLLLTTDLHIAVANVISYGCGAAVSFCLNKNITFRSNSVKPKTGESLMMFALLTLVMILFSTLATVGFAQIVDPALAKLFSALVVAALSFFGMKYVVFR